MSIAAQTLKLLAKDTDGNTFFKVLGKAKDKITISVSTENELGLEDISIATPEALKKVTVGQKVVVTGEGDDLKFEILTAPEKTGRTAKTSTPGNVQSAALTA